MTTSPSHCHQDLRLENNVRCYKRCLCACVCACVSDRWSAACSADIWLCVWLHYRPATVSAANISLPASYRQREGKREKRGRGREEEKETDWAGALLKLTRHKELIQKPACTCLHTLFRRTHSHSKTLHRQECLVFASLCFHAQMGTFATMLCFLSRTSILKTNSTLKELYCTREWEATGNTFRKLLFCGVILYNYFKAFCVSQLIQDFKKSTYFKLKT